MRERRKYMFTSHRTMKESKAHTHTSKVSEKFDTHWSGFFSSFCFVSLVYIFSRTNLLIPRKHTHISLFLLLESLDASCLISLRPLFSFLFCFPLFFSSSFCVFGVCVCFVRLARVCISVCAHSFSSSPSPSLSSSSLFYFFRQ